MEKRGFDQQKYQEELSKITLDKIKKGMDHYNFSKQVQKVLLEMFKERIKHFGEDEFKMYIYNLHFTVPQEIEDETIASKLYDSNQYWFEKEIKKLESELNMSYEEQSEDLEHLNVKARKAQLVIRHRLYTIILDISDNQF